MSRNTLLGEALAAYLAGHFDKVRIEPAVALDGNGGGWSFPITADGVEYRFNVLDEATAGLDHDASIALFENNRVASVMRDLSGFPVTLTNSGCIFGDL